MAYPPARLECVEKLHLTLTCSMRAERFFRAVAQAGARKEKQVQLQLLKNNVATSIIPSSGSQQPKTNAIKRDSAQGDARNQSETSARLDVGATHDFTRVELTPKKFKRWLALGFLLMSSILWMPILGLFLSLNMSDYDTAGNVILGALFFGFVLAPIGAAIAITTYAVMWWKYG